MNRLPEYPGTSGGRGTGGRVGACIMSRRSRSEGHGELGPHVHFEFFNPSGHQGQKYSRSVKIEAMRLIARIPYERLDSDIQWLVLEDDPDDTSGFFLFFHSSLDEPSEFDNWHETQDLARAEAWRLNGITEENWQSTPKA